jgi:hypothetical protein
MSLGIDISNYELYAMDYIEGELSQEDKAHFEAFFDEAFRCGHGSRRVNGFRF